MRPNVLNAMLLQVHAHSVEMDSGGMVLIVQPALQDALNVRMTEVQLSIVPNAHLIKYRVKQLEHVKHVMAIVQIVQLILQLVLNASHPFL